MDFWRQLEHKSRLVLIKSSLDRGASFGCAARLTSVQLASLGQKSARTSGINRCQQAHIELKATPTHATGAPLRVASRLGARWTINLNKIRTFWAQLTGQRRQTYLCLLVIILDSTQMGPQASVTGSLSARTPVKMSASFDRQLAALS